MLRSRRRGAGVLALVGLLALPGVAAGGELALFRLDPLGVDPQIVARLEGLMRLELSRLADATLPTAARIRELMQRDPSLQDCTGEIGCLVSVGRQLGVQRVISGNVGGLGESYVVNLKIVDVASAKELRRIQEPLSGEPDQLIEAVRVAAYGLVAPERLRGAISVLADQPEATVYLSGKPYGTTPLQPIRGLSVGTYVLRVAKEGYTDVVQTVTVRFQKTAQVVVKLEAPRRGPAGPTPAPRAARPYPWYTRWWFWTTVAVVAAGLGAGLGYAVSKKDTGVNCSQEPGRCGL